MDTRIYSEKYNIDESDVGKEGMLKISRMFDILHDAADHELSRENLGKVSLFERGFMWVLAEQTAEIESLPRINDDIVIKTWVGKEFSTFIPRYYEIESSDGKVMVRVSTVWAVISIKERKAINPSAHKIIIEPKVTGREIKILNTPKSLEITREADSKIIPEYIDFNNHMNNARYFDMTDKVDSIIEGERIPRSVIARYSHEAFLGDKVHIKIGCNGDSKYICIDSDRGNHFKSRIEY